jgi:ADP-heptose:LPS heptosyltransferase
MSRPPRLLFVPAVGAGAGEYVRCLVLAEAFRERRPDAEIRFAIDRKTPRFEHDVFEHHLIDGRPSKNVARVKEVLRERSPDVVVFDNTLRTAQLRCARQIGARTVFIATLPPTLRRAFRVRRLRRLNQLWIVQRRMGREPPALSAWERGKLRLAPRVEVAFLDAIFAESQDARRKELEKRLGLDGAPYVLFVPGGGGWQRRGRPVSEIWLEAARRVSEATAVTCIVVMGPLYAGPTPARARFAVLGSLRPDQMIDLLHGAHVVATGGGGTSIQAVTQGRVCVAAPTGGNDQYERIRAWGERDWIEPCQADSESIEAAVVRLLRDPQRHQAIRARIESLGFSNGLAEGVRRLESLLLGT